MNEEYVWKDVGVVGFDELMQALERADRKGYMPDAVKEAWEGFNWKPAQQEPVAWMFQHEETGRTMCVDAQQVEWGFEKGNPRLKKIAPLYTSPPASKPLVGLTDEEILAVARNHYNPHQRAEISFARAIEAKLKEKNT